MKKLALFAMIALLAGPANAASLLGTWAAEPDAKGQTGHIDITPCGNAVCGTIARVFDRSGNQVSTPSVGRRVLRDVRQTGPNEYNSGKAYVPLLRAEFPVEIKLDGTRLQLRACNSTRICRSQTWKRVR